MCRGSRGSIGIAISLNYIRIVLDPLPVADHQVRRIFFLILTAAMGHGTTDSGENSISVSIPALIRALVQFNYISWIENLFWKLFADVSYLVG